MKNMFVEEAPGIYRTATKPEIVAAALRSLRVQRGVTFSSPSVSRDWLRLRLGSLEHEVFGVVFLDSQHRLIEFFEASRGTLTQTSVYPREILKRAIQVNAATVILTHNHPSGSPEPSMADRAITDSIKSALAFIDVRILDHVVVGADRCYSFAENGLV